MDLVKTGGSYDWQPCILLIRGSVMSDILDVKSTSKNIREKENKNSILKSNSAEKNKKQEYLGLEGATENKNSKKIQNDKDKSIKKKNKVITALSIATAVLGLSTIGLGIGFAITDSMAMEYKTDLENVYQSNFYSLLDNVNNLETKMTKILNSSSSSYQRKTLLEASKNASEAEIAVASLPFSQSDIDETVKMVNQISGYTSTLADNLANGGSLTQEDIATLEDIEQSVMSLKTQLNQFANKIKDDYSIIDASMDIDTNSNAFSRSLASLKDNDVEYPSMIYDGPFSDSVVNSKVKGLSGDKVTKSEAKQNVEKFFKTATTIENNGETKGRFETYNFTVKNADDEMLYVQVTKIGGHILTISGAGQSGAENIDIEKAKNIALDFATQNGIEDAAVVWSDSIGSDVYLNIAPQSQNIVLYPDLVKVKVNMTSGTIVGYDATSYFTNHVDRTLSKGSLSLSQAEEKVPTRFSVISSRYALSPLDYNREVVCVEVQAHDEGNTYYFYYNVENGIMENVLKVIETDNGNLLM